MTQQDSSSSQHQCFTGDLRWVMLEDISVPSLLPSSLNHVPTQDAATVHLLVMWLHIKGSLARCGSSSYLKSSPQDTFI